MADRKLTGEVKEPAEKAGPEDAPMGKGEKKATVSPDVNPFLLEEIYPDPVDVFAPTLVADIAASDALVVMDTNALLLPYKIGKDDLGALRESYKKLAEKKRLFLPARVAREFIKNRDRNVADLMKMMSDQGSRISVSVDTLSPILDGVNGYDDLKKASATLAEGRKAYLKALDRVRAGNCLARRRPGDRALR
jgi:hypothetical protein